MDIEATLNDLTTAYRALLEAQTKSQGEVALLASLLRTFATVPYGTILPFSGPPSALAGTEWAA